MSSCWIVLLIGQSTLCPCLRNRHHLIPPKSNRTETIAFNKRKYRKRNLVERCINKLKQFRHIATRYDRKASAYLACAKLAAVRLWLRVYESAA
ncbi:MAG: transposase [Alphaproteobacteria bacterium]|nr:transposase [Alphaproteobacteria bacterium]